MELNLAGMKNWIHGLPVPNDKTIFENVLKLVSSTNAPLILEVGTYVGVSLINILERVPNSIGYAVDNWSLDQKECYRGDIDLKSTFFSNIKKAGMENRVFMYEGDSLNTLTTFLSNSLKFDFIYVDGSHKCLETYSDLVLSWGCLKKNGILAIDDYLWNLHDPRVDDFEKPVRAIDYFLNKIKGKYEPIDIGYRVFIKKICN